MYRRVSTADSTPSCVLASLRAAEVEAAGQLAQDQDVGAGPDLGTQRRRRVERGVGGDGAQVGEELERRSQAEQRVLGPGGCRGIIPLRTAHGAEQDGVGGTACLEGGSRQRVTGRVDRGTADQLLVPAHLESEPRSGGLDAASRHVADLRADPVAGKVGHAVPPHGWLPAGVGTGSPPERRCRAASIASAAIGCSAMQLVDGRQIGA